MRPVAAAYRRFGPLAGRAASPDPFRNKTMSSTLSPSRSALAAAQQSQAERHWRSGVEHGRAGRWKEAEKAHARATRIAPGEPLFWVNLGQARRKLGDLDGAAEAAGRALEADPRSTLAAQLRLSVRLESNRFADAIVDVERIVSRGDAMHGTWLEYAIALDRVGRHREAVSAGLQALARKPDLFEAHVLLCNAFDPLGLHAEAVECLRTAVALRPGWEQGLGGILYHSLFACDWRRLDADLEALRAALAEPRAHDIGPFMFLSFGAGAAEQKRIFTEHAQRQWSGAKPLPPLVPPHGAPPAKLRVGYLSNDFNNHATATLLIQALEMQDRSRIEVRAYSYSNDDGTPLRRRIEAAFDAFVDVSTVTDAQAAQRIRDDGVEILVDLKGYTRHARPGILALRPAPIQAAWLGFPGTSGMSFIDYAIVDPVVVPPSKSDEFTEKLAWLPDCYQPNDRARTIGPAPGRAACGLPEDGFVFCCFNHTYKIRPEIFDVWCRLLRDVPASVLWLLESNARARENLEREAQARGIEAHRIVFAPRATTEAHLARLRHADLVLDTLPINAHTTASDALWAGAPIVTCVGDAFVGRVCASLLGAVGLPDLVTADLGAYESLARSLATEPAHLASIRDRLRVGRDRGALFDAERFARELDALLLRMAERWRAGLEPEHLPARAVTAAPGAEAPAAAER
jgi:predicted O-linked N-acetylglucosamine transferase (SPINDLY family)